MLSVVWLREELEPKLTPFQTQMFAQGAGSPSTSSSVQAPWGTRSHTAAAVLQGAGACSSAATVSDGRVHPEAHMLVDTLAQVLLQE